jgi:hypothetical protein
MKKILPFVAVASVLAFTSCGKNQQTTNPVLSQDEECPRGNCTEQSLNAPTGEQPKQEPQIPYDQVEGNPPRGTLRFPAFDPAWGLTRHVYDKAVAYYARNGSALENPRYFTIVDFNLSASQRRLFLFDLSNDHVEKHAVAAGKNSDPTNSGYATHFSNDAGSEESSLGFYKTLATYNGAHGLSLRLSGLSPTNSNAEARAIVMHPASYVDDSVPHAGRSWGCTAIDPSVSAGVIAKLKNGSIMLVDR